MDINPTTWRTEPQLRGLQASVQRGINLSTNGAYVEIDIGTAHALIDALKQARRTEIGNLERAE